MVTPSSIKQQLWRELRVASVIGGIFSLTLGGVSFLMYKHVELSLLLAVYVVISVCVSAVLGACIPYTIRFRFGQDPAGMGGPFITTTMDLLMYTSYLIALSLLASRMI
jgi:Mg/Co/Ni transporter MgtE